MNYKDKALEIIDRLKFNGYVNNRERGVLRRALLEERPQGAWVMNKISARGRNYTCTNCQKVSRSKSDFCQKCGADMRGKTS